MLKSEKHLSRRAAGTPWEQESIDHSEEDKSNSYEAPDTLIMGRRLGKYLLSNRRARQESHGIEVKVGRDLSTNRGVTVKVFDTGTTRAAGVGELIKFEVATMSRTNWHPNVVQLLDVLASPTKIFVVMETISGGDLFEAIASEGR